GHGKTVKIVTAVVGIILIPGPVNVVRINRSCIGPVPVPCNVLLISPIGRFLLPYVHIRLPPLPELLVRVAPLSAGTVPSHSYDTGIIGRRTDGQFFRNIVSCREIEQILINGTVG